MFNLAETLSVQREMCQLDTNKSLDFLLEALSTRTIEHFVLDDEQTSFKQHITIMTNPAAARRGSMADYAFPELHTRKVWDAVCGFVNTRRAEHFPTP